MTDTRRLVAKLDEAIRALKPQRRAGQADGTRLAEALRDRFATGRPFEIAIAGRVYPVRCDRVRISRTTVDLGLDTSLSVIPLTRVTTCQHGVDGDGNPVNGFGVDDGGHVTPLAIA